MKPHGFKSPFLLSTCWGTNLALKYLKKLGRNGPKWPLRPWTTMSEVAAFQFSLSQGWAKEPTPLPTAHPWIIFSYLMH